MLISVKSAVAKRQREMAARSQGQSTTPPRQAIHEHPGLLGAYFPLDSARKVAEARIGNAESRERFVALVRDALAHATERGERLPSAKLHAPAPAPGRAVEDTRSARQVGPAR